MNKIKLSKSDFEILSLIIDKFFEMEELSKSLNIPLSSLFSKIEVYKQKGWIELKEENLFKVKLNEEGKDYARNGLPESRLVKILQQKGEIKIENLKEFFDDKTLKIALTNAFRRKLLTYSNGILKLSSNLDLSLENKLKELYEKNEIEVKELTQDINELLRRNLVELKSVKKVFIKASESFKVEFIAGNILVVEEKSKLTSEDIITGRWKEYILKPYNLEALPPKLYFGRSHIYMKFLEEVKKILLEMGFEEAEGPYILPEFWNFDVLFVPQDHPARDMHATFRVDLPPVKLEGEIVKRVKEMHEKGGIENSIGWRYEWKEDIANKLILRTHTTTVSISYLYNNKDKEAKVFCISRNFRYDLPDATHSPEFYQCEGIMVGPKLNFANLLAFFKDFSERLGIEKIRFRPTYFPFTEPSVEGIIYHKKLGWIEALPGGMFRPEILKALEIRYPVLAWGIGIDRLAMAALDIEDIRELFSQNISFLRNYKIRNANH
ncbi:MAG: phenylalanine--tRNA ligase subunit alpha [Thermoproteota archaeon]